MIECDCIAGCPFFNDKMANKPTTAEMYKKKYCKGDFKSCARYMVKTALGKPAVPADMFPNQQDKAKELIKQAS